jgi:hypothetical protein
VEQVFHSGSEEVTTCLRGRDYKPWHSILFDATGSQIQVVVRLFGYLVWRIKLLNVGPGELPSIGCRLDLSSGEHFLKVFEEPGVS